MYADQTDQEISFAIEVKRQQLLAITNERAQLLQRETKTYREMQILEHVLARRRAHQEQQMELVLPRRQLA